MMERPGNSASPSLPVSDSTPGLPDAEPLNLPKSPVMLRNGRRIDFQDRSYSGPARQGPVRYISEASLTLERIMEQDRTHAQVNKAPKVPAMTAPGPVAAAKGKPRLLLMGQRRSGKSSISSVVFHKMPANETLFLESTTRILKDSMHSFMDFQVWDFPGQVDYFNAETFDLDSIFGTGQESALIWVIDAQDEYLETIAKLNTYILALRETYPSVNTEVFIHKVDGLSDDYRVDIQRDIIQRIQDELSDAGYENAPVTFHLTSIYDHSIFEAFSNVIQKLIPHLATLEALLNDLCRKCRFEKVYLFDVLTKIYIATDSTPVDMQSYEICSDYIDVIVDISEVYGWQRPPEYLEKLEGEPFNKPLDEQTGSKNAESCIVLSEEKRPLLLREVDEHLALVAIMKEGTHGKMPMVTFNVEVVVQALTKVFEITRKEKKGVQT